MASLYPSLTCSQHTGSQRSPNWKSVIINERTKSINRKFGSAISLGEKKGWVPDGRLCDEWNDQILPIIMRIYSDNYETIYKGQEQHSQCTIELWMVGRDLDIQDPHPTIVVRCEPKIIATRIIETLEQAKYFVEVNRDFDFLAREDSIHLSSRYLPGSRMTIQGNTAETTCSETTLGGFVVVAGKIYGLTAAHLLIPAGVNLSGANESDSDSDEVEAQDYRELFRLPDHFGLPIYQSTSTPNVQHETVQPDILGTADVLHTGNDWVLVRIKDTSVITSNSFHTSEGVTISPSRVATDVSAQPVHIAAHEGLKPSRLWGIKNGLTIPGSTRMVESWPLDGEVDTGFSGTWVISSSEDGDVWHGTVVCCCPGMSYLIPAHAIVADIAQSFGPPDGPPVQVSLPTQEDVTAMSLPANRDTAPTNSQIQQYPRLNFRLPLWNST